MPTRLRDDRLMIVLLLSFALGMAIALTIYSLWRAHGTSAQLDSAFTAVSLFLCPPFILSVAANLTPESTLATVLVVGTIVSANGCLYAGVAAGGYFVYTVLERRRRR